MGGYLKTSDFNNTSTTLVNTSNAQTISGNKHLAVWLGSNAVVI